MLIPTRALIPVIWNARQDLEELEASSRIGVGRVGGVVSRVGCRRRENTPLIYSCTIALASEPDKVLTLFHTQGETHGRAREQRGDTRFEFISPRRKEGRVERGGRWSCIEFFESFWYRLEMIEIGGGDGTVHMLFSLCWEKFKLDGWFLLCTHCLCFVRCWTCFLICEYVSE